jgi:uridine kinase
MVTITLPGGEKRQVEAGTPARALLPARTAKGLPILAVRFNNKVASIERPLDRDGELDFIDMSSRDGGLIYRRSLTFLLIRAIHDLFPDLRVYINHSLNKGYYGEVYNNKLDRQKPILLAESDVARIKERMKALIAEDVPFVRTELPISEAIKRFAAAGLDDKVELLQHRDPEDTISVYYCGDLLNHFYGQLVPSTGLLHAFDIHLCGPGFVLLFPPHGRPDELPEYVHEERMFAVYQEYERWSRILGVRTVAHLNGIIKQGAVKEYILIAEALHEKKLAQIADMITNHPRHPRIVLLSGPSSSGKTTTVKRLSIQMRINGMRPLLLGLDDFFVERERTPRDASGDYDFEAFDAIDVPLLQATVQRLLSGEEVAVPKFDFVQGRPVPGHKVRLEPGQPLILEGIHALNPGLLPSIPDGMKFKLYISPLTHLNIDDHNRLASSDARLIRRLVRDSRYRGYDAIATLGRWPSVRRGEERNIFPYQNRADCIFNSSLPYEVCVLKQYAVPVLKEVPREHPLHSEAARLLKFMSYFEEIKTDFVPRHSLLREFIGGSAFKY